MAPSVVKMVQRKCLVCGRSFPEGQGIVIVKDNIVLEFHSSRCVAKFFKRMIEDSPDISCLRDTIRELVEEYKEKVSKASEKKI